MLRHDLRQAARRLARSPLFTIVSLVTLATGIGATTAIFAVVESVLLRPLPFEEPERLVGVWHTAPGLNFDVVPMHAALYFSYREESRTFEDIGLWDNESVSVTGAGEPEQIVAMQVTDGTLPLLRVQPFLGRLFTKAGDAPGSPLTTILSYGYWQQRFGGDSDAVGSTIIVDVESIPGVRVERVEPNDYVSQVEIATRLGRSRQSVSQLVSGARGPGGFPPPAFESGRVALWRWSAVSAWLTAAGFTPAGEEHASMVIGAANALLEARRAMGALDGPDRASLFDLVA